MFKGGWLQNKQGGALAAEKRKDYRNIVILQTLIIISALLLKDVLSFSGVGTRTSYIIRDTLFLSLGGIYVFILWDLLRNYVQDKRLIRGMFYVILITLGLAVVTVNPFYKVFPTEAAQQPYLFIVHLVLFIVEATVIYYAIVDLFSGDRLSTEKLWGTVCIYLMIGISFGSVYDLINIIRPGSMGIPLEMGLESYAVCIFYSMNMIGGHDAFEDAHPLIHNIGVIETVWSNLFVVVLVGRLLTKPGDDV